MATAAAAMVTSKGGSWSGDRRRWSRRRWTRTLMPIPPAGCPASEAMLIVARVIGGGSGRFRRRGIGRIVAGRRRRRRRRIRAKAAATAAAGAPVPGAVRGVPVPSRRRRLRRRAAEGRVLPQLVPGPGANHGRRRPARGGGSDARGREAEEGPATGPPRGGGGGAVVGGPGGRGVCQTKDVEQPSAGPSVRRARRLPPGRGRRASVARWFPLLDVRRRRGGGPGAAGFG
ncbi:unnamed protein product, partial [Ectocarpus fasciculatus]